VDRVEGRHRVVAGDSVLGRQHRSRTFDILQEQGVMADAEAEHDVEIGPGLVQDHGLANGITH